MLLKLKYSFLLVISSAFFIPSLSYAAEGHGTGHGDDHDHKMYVIGFFAGITSQKTATETEKTKIHTGLSMNFAFTNTLVLGLYMKQLQAGTTTTQTA